MYAVAPLISYVVFVVLHSATIFSNVVNAINNPEHSYDPHLHGTTPHCSLVEFDCIDSHQCIPKDKVCDDHYDCKDRSDEEHCPPTNHIHSEHKFTDDLQAVATHPVTTPDYSCTVAEFQCHDDHKQCIPRPKICDGNYDCFDRSDEEHCDGYPGNSVACSDYNFNCQRISSYSGPECIDFARVCDNHRDCSNGNDENSLHVNCTHNPCKENNGDCEHYCINTYKGSAVCTCEKGYQVSNTDARKCNDINECLIWGTCSHICHNIIGSYNCICKPDYQKSESNPNVCVAVGNDMLSIITFTRREILEITLNKKTLQVERRQVIKTLTSTSLSNLQIDAKSQTFYWAEDGQIRVFNTRFETTIEIKDKMRIPKTGMRIAYDWTHSLLYCTYPILLRGDKKSYKMVAINVTSPNKTTMIMVRNNSIENLLLDPEFSVLYWSESKSDFVHYIYTSSMDGRFIEQIGVQTEPILSMDYDRPTSRLTTITRSSLYHYTGVLQFNSYNFHGSDLHVTYLNDMNHDEEKMNDFILFEDYLYQVDSTGSLIRINKFTGALDTLYKLKFQEPIPSGWINLIVNHGSVQLITENKCSEHECSDICIPTKWDFRYPLKLYSCQCPLGMYLKPNKNTCAPEKESPRLTKDLFSNKHSTYKTPKLLNASANNLVAATSLKITDKQSPVVISVVIVSILLAIVVIVILIFKFKHQRGRSHSNFKQRSIFNNNNETTSKLSYSKFKNAELRPSESSENLTSAVQPTSSKIAVVSKGKNTADSVFTNDFHYEC